MRNRNQSRLDALRFLKNAIQLTEKDQMKELDESSVLDVVAKQVKDRRESIRMFQEGGRDDLVTKEAADLTILEEYLPPQLDQEEFDSDRPGSNCRSGGDLRKGQGPGDGQGDAPSSWQGRRGPRSTSWWKNCWLPNSPGHTCGLSHTLPYDRERSAEIPPCRGPAMKRPGSPRGGQDDCKVVRLASYRLEKAGLQGWNRGFPPPPPPLRG